MGREIRMVPKNWEHPKKDSGDYIPLFEDYEGTAKQWLEDCIQWASPENKDRRKLYGEYFWEGDTSSPDSEDYVDYKKENSEWYQMYETVTEGTPVTPPFETKAELIHYLCTEGTFWAPSPWSQESAIKFVNVGWLPSGILTGGNFLTGQDILASIPNE